MISLVVGVASARLRAESDLGGCDVCRRCLLRAWCPSALPLARLKRHGEIQVLCLQIAPPCCVFTRGKLSPLLFCAFRFPNHVRLIHILRHCNTWTSLNMKHLSALETVLTRSWREVPLAELVGLFQNRLKIPKRS